MRIPRGFTLLEVTLVIALLTTLFGVGFSAASTLRNIIAERGARQVESLLLTAAGRARNGVDGTSWGVYLPYDETSRQGAAATIFSGASYATRDAAKDIPYPLDESLRFTEAFLSGDGSSDGNDHEIVFGSQTGATEQYGSLTIDTHDKTVTIEISPSGTVARPSL